MVIKSRVLRIMYVPVNTIQPPRHFYLFLSRSLILSRFISYWGQLLFSMMLFVILKSLRSFATCTSPTMHPICPPNFARPLFFIFPGYYSRPKVHYGRCASGEWKKMKTMTSAKFAYWLIGSLSNHDGNGNENVTWKSSWHFSNFITLVPFHAICLTLGKSSGFDSKGRYLSSER